MEGPILDVRHLKKYFKTPKGMLHAVDGVSFTVERGKTLGVVGESGCGKSTLGRTVLRTIEPTEGEILFDGEDIVKYNRSRLHELRRKMQMIFQDPYSSLNPRMTVFEIIAEPLLIMGEGGNKKELLARVEELMDTVGLSRRLINAYPHELDGGRRQRIGVARALALKPDFIVCDEPVSALDVSIQAQILNLMMDLQDQLGLTYIFITHDLSVVKHISHNILVMYLGECIEQCESDELFEDPLHPYTKALLSAIAIPASSEHDRKREILRGEVVSPINPKPGCRFAPRCPFATSECSEQEPAFNEVRSGHFVKCHKVAVE